MPSKLVAINDTSTGCDLILTDGCRIPLDVSLATIRDYVISDGFSDLQPFIDAQRIDVYFQPVAVSPDDWDSLASIVRHADSPLAAVPELFTLLSLNHSQISALPHRLYGGIGCAVDDLPPVFYTSPTADFVADDHRGGDWYRWLFTSRGFNVYQTHVNMADSTVDVEVGNLPNHYLENPSVT